MRCLSKTPKWPRVKATNLRLPLQDHHLLASGKSDLKNGVQFFPKVKFVHEEPSFQILASTWKSDLHEKNREPLRAQTWEWAMQPLLIYSLVKVVARKVGGNYHQHLAFSTSPKLHHLFVEWGWIWIQSFGHLMTLQSSYPGRQIVLILHDLLLTTTLTGLPLCYLITPPSRSTGNSRQIQQ